MNEESLESGVSVEESQESVEDSESSVSDLSESSSIEENTTTIAYEDSIQYDVNYNFGYLSIWLGAIFGVLLIIAFMKGFGND